MKSRIIGSIAAVLLALVGAVLLIQYVNSAEQRALAGAQTQPVLVVREGLIVPEGTPAEGLTELVETVAVPSRVVPADAIGSLSEVPDLITTVQLVGGEQLLSTRFIDPEAANDDVVIEVPEGMQEVTILLEPQRVVGGQFEPGDTVGVFVSLPSAEGFLQPVTHLTLNKVLVSNVQGLAAETEESSATSADPIPPGSVLVTMAVLGSDAEKIVFAQEFGTIWLSKEPDSATEDGLRPVTSNEIYE